MGSNSILAGGGLSFAIEKGDIENHIKETLYIGKDLNDREWGNELAKGGGKEFEFLKTLGVNLVHRPPLGYLVQIVAVRQPNSHEEKLLKKRLGCQKTGRRP